MRNEDRRHEREGGRKNPYASKLNKQVTIRMGEDVIAYFKAMSEEMGMPYQGLINLYLRDCVAKKSEALEEFPITTSGQPLVTTFDVAVHA